MAEVADNIKSIIEGWNEAMFTTTLTGEITYWSAGAERLFGWREEEVIGKSPPIVPLHKAEENSKLLSQVSQGKVLPHIKTERIHKSGELLKVMLTLLPLRDAQGEVSGAITVANIAESNRIAQELYERNRELSALEAITDEINKYLDVDVILKKIVDLAGSLVNTKYTSIVIADEQGRLKACAENFQGIPPLSLRARPDGVTRKILASGRVEVVDEVKANSKTNPALVAAGIKSYVGVPIKFEDEVLGVLFAHSDNPRAFNDRQIRLLATFASQAAIAIRNARLYQDLQTQMKNLQETQAQLVQAEKLAAIGRLAANVAHEINNPLTAVLMASSSLLEEINENDTKKSQLEIVKRESVRARGIIRNLLDFARPGEPKTAEADINELAQGTARLLRHSMEMKGVELVEHYASEALKATVDRNQITQVFYNLISNALDAMLGGGRLTITTGVKGDKLFVDFKDSGIGISPENMDKLFEPFFSTKPDAKGTGLGLSISYNIIKSFGGGILVKSKVGKGSTFRVCLPMAKQSTDQ